MGAGPSSPGCAPPGLELPRCRRRNPERAEDSFALTEPPERGLPLTAGVWLAYGVGAVVGGAAELLWQPAVLLLPTAAVAAGVVVLAPRHPQPLDRANQHGAFLPCLYERGE